MNGHVHGHGESGRRERGRALRRAMDSEEEDEVTSWDGGDEDEDEKMDVDDGEREEARDTHDDEDEEEDLPSLIVKLRIPKDMASLFSSPQPQPQPNSHLEVESKEGPKEEEGDVDMSDADEFDVPARPAPSTAVNGTGVTHADTAQSGPDTIPHVSEGAAATAIPIKEPAGTSTNTPTTQLPKTEPAPVIPPSMPIHPVAPENAAPTAHASKAD